MCSNMFLILLKLDFKQNVPMSEKKKSIAFSSSEPEPAAFEQLLPPEGNNQQWRNWDEPIDGS